MGGERIKTFLTLLAFLLSTCGVFASTTLFYDDFTGTGPDLDNTLWPSSDSSGEYWRTDVNPPQTTSDGFYFTGTDNSYITSKSTDTTNHSNIHLKFKMALDTLTGASCQAQYYSISETTWVTVAEILTSTGNKYVVPSYDITLPPEAENIADLQIRFRIYGTGYMKLDEVYVVDNPPAVEAGVNKTIRLPTSSAIISGAATDGTHVIPATWTLLTNPSGIADIVNPSSLTTEVTGLTAAGDYVFRLTATDSDGQVVTDDVTITVNPNISPIVNAGPDIFIYSPDSATTLFGMAMDSGGTIISRQWTQAPANPVLAILTGDTTNTLSVSGLTAVGNYVFTFTATDNSAPSASDTVTVTVLAAPDPLVPANFPTFNSIPYAIGMAIDDLGWKLWVYKDSLNTRDANVTDYQLIMDVGKEVGTRIMTAWIMCDMDRNFICAKPKYNTPYKMTADGTNWDNRWHYYDNDFDLMDLVKDQNAYMEFGLHGASHIHPIGNRNSTDPYYPDYMYDFKNGEFADVDTLGVYNASLPWGWDDMRNRATCFQELIRQYYTSDEMSFPEAFVPPGH
ncbi:MAG: hypothetical protein WC637_09840, partial [Victivallales bacterium]